MSKRKTAGDVISKYKMKTRAAFGFRQKNRFLSGFHPFWKPNLPWVPRPISRPDFKEGLEHNPNEFGPRFWGLRSRRYVLFSLFFLFLFFVFGSCEFAYHCDFFCCVSLCLPLFFYGFFWVFLEFSQRC